MERCSDCPVSQFIKTLPEQDREFAEEIAIELVDEQPFLIGCWSDQDQEEMVSSMKEQIGSYDDPGAARRILSEDLVKAVHLCEVRIRRGECFVVPDVWE